MAKSKDVHDPQAISEFISKLDPSLAELVEAIRQVILGTDRNIGEQVKWNSPSFFYTGAMKPFDPKEYKRDIVVVNVRKKNALLVFPTGATIADDSGFLTGDYKDGRRLAEFNSLEEVKAKAKNLQAVIKKWLSLL
jgi:uncharacterized protein YdhG (YjbR/CyaY superfamily)